ncbi:MAG: flagellar filament capping protein FliD [Lutisporaceae bacterium]
MASNITNLLNTTTRITGLASGLDTDSIVKQLMAIERAKVDRVKQNKVLVEWRRDNYREVSNLLRGFQDGFFDYLKPSNNMRSPSTYNIYNSTSTNPTVATATGGVGITSTSHTIDVIALAKAATGTSTVAVTKGISGDVVGSFNIDGYNKTIAVNYNGVSKDIIIPDGSYTDAASLLGDGTDGKLVQLIQEAFNGGVTVGAVDGKIQFATANASDVLTIATKSATGDNLLGTLGVSSSGIGTALNFDTPMEIKQGMKFEVTAVESGVATTKVIQWGADSTYSDANQLAVDIQAKIDAAFGASGKVNVTATDNTLAFAAGAGVESFSLANGDIVRDLGLQSVESNKLSLSDNMEKVSSKLINGDITFDSTGKFTLTINDTNIDVYKTDSLSTFLSKVNNSAAGVNLSYSTHSDTFSMTAKTTGAGTIAINDNGSNFFTKINLTSTAITAGGDATFNLDGLAGTRTTNSFTADGVTYNLASIGSTTINLTQNTDEVFNKIKTFVDKYNEVIGKIGNEVSEKYERAYTPLTDEQKEAMSEDEIKLWEEKAKTGLLRNDSMLNNMVTNMRLALSSAITDISGGLSTIGITTGTYLDKGKLVIDETKLKDAIKSNPDNVINIFTKESEISYTSVIGGVGSRTDRYNQNGIINRLYDIMQDNIRTTRDINGKKGLLLEKAGIVGDLSEFNNILDADIDIRERAIDILTEKLYDKEDRYYKKFTALEKAMSQMNSQSSWIAQQFGG